jgi:hypothetical protein
MRRRIVKFIRQDFAPRAPYFALWTGTTCLVVAAWHAREIYVREAWPKAEATVGLLGSKTESGVGSGRFGNVTFKLERVDFRYEYSITGEVYSSSCFYPFGGQPSFGYLAQNYQPGTKFWAHYNPAHPQQAFVETGGPAFVLFGIGLLCVVYAGGMLYHRRSRSG